MSNGWHKDIRCNCEHIDHENGRGHEYLATLPGDGAARAMYVGTVCKKCTDTHLTDYLLHANQVR